MAVNRNLAAFAAVNGAAAVALGAFAAHGAGPQIKTLLTTGAQYQLAHALLAVACALWPGYPRLVHIASDFIAACVPAVEGTLLGDKAVSAVFDNAKLKRFVPGFAAKVRYADGIRRTIAWFDADPARQEIDAATNARWDALVAAYAAGLDRARAALAGL